MRRPVSVLQHGMSVASLKSGAGHAFARAHFADEL
jgi:hypothetical protein